MNCCQISNCSIRLATIGLDYSEIETNANNPYLGMVGDTPNCVKDYPNNMCQEARLNTMSRLKVKWGGGEGSGLLLDVYY